MSRVVISALVMAMLCAEAPHAQTDPQTSLWMALRKQLSGPNGEKYFDDDLKGGALPRLKGTLVSALLNEGVSRVVLKMPGSDQPAVTLIVHHGDLRVKGDPRPGTSIEFAGKADDFVKAPFMLTVDVKIDDLSGLEFLRR